MGANESRARGAGEASTSSHASASASSPSSTRETESVGPTVGFARLFSLAPTTKRAARADLYARPTYLAERVLAFQYTGPRMRATRGTRARCERTRRRCETRTRRDTSFSSR